MMSGAVGGIDVLVGLSGLGGEVLAADQVLVGLGHLNPRFAWVGQLLSLAQWCKRGRHGLLDKQIRCGNDSRNG